jgi:excisionase family DNA binding protein
MVTKIDAVDNTEQTAASVASKSFRDSARQPFSSPSASPAAEPAGGAAYPTPRQGFATIVEAAGFLGLTRQTVSVLIYEGKIPARRYGKRALRIPWSWLYDEAQRAHEERPAEYHPKLEHKKRTRKGRMLFVRQE